MKDKNGGYYAAIDADSGGVEGKFYVWDKNEIEKILGDAAALFNAYFDVSEEGNREHKNILRILNPLNSVAEEFNIEINDAEKKLKKQKRNCLQKETKNKTGKDDKIY